MSSTLEARLVLRAIDQASGVIRRVGSAMRGINGRSMAMAAQSWKRMNAAMHGPGSYGAALVGGVLLNRQYTFEKALNRTQAILNQTSREGFAPLRNEIVRIASAYPAMRDEIAKGSAELAMAGMSQKTVQAVLEKTVQGSMASGESIALVGAGVTDVIMGMALPFKTAAEQAQSFAAVNDKLVASATSFNETYTDLLAGLTRFGPTARAAGVSLHDAVALVGQLADTGFKGSAGGIALSSSITRLGAPTKRARAQLRAFNIELDRFSKQTGRFANAGGQALVDMLSEELGLSGLEELVPSLDAILKDKSITENATALGDTLTKAIVGGLDLQQSADASGRARDIIARFVRSSYAELDVLGLFREMAAKNVDRNADFMKQVFGLHHLKKMQGLFPAIRSGQFDTKSAQVAKRTADATERFAGIMTQGIVGAWAKFTSAVDVLMDNMLVKTGVMGDLTAFVNYVRGFVTYLQDTNPTLLKFGTYAILAMAALAPLGLVIAGVSSAVGVLAAAIGVLFAPITLIVIAIAVAAGLIWYYWDDIKAAFFSAVEWVSSTIDSIKTSIHDGLVGVWDSVVGAVEGTWNRIVNTISGAVDLIMKIIGKVKAGIAMIVSNMPAVKLMQGAIGLLSGAKTPKVSGARADGGDVAAGHTYRINERGQEFFTPSRSGRIIPNHRLGGVNITTAPITVNITASGANAADIIRQAKTRLRDELQAALRGAIADTGIA